ncbi:MAG: Crp/Fnr family transcriptional regulator [Hyphomicrobiales bacterium]|nr:Crp/Fnr family transcriptional regulator [Hyphomicrobiales bacterium]MCP5373110.1 Crp/Fnr family transcriptional regulator [Hyphomicrobiales bacterium]
MSDDFVSAVVSRSGRRRRLDRGAFLFHRGDPVAAVFVVGRGSIELTRFQQGGRPIVLQRAGPGQLVAEASVYSAAYHCDGLAAEATVVHELPRAAFLDLLAGDPALFHSWAAHLAREVQSARVRSEVLSRHTVADRLDGWLTWTGGGLPARGQWRSVAAQIGVSPEALYRELAKRRRSS